MFGWDVLATEIAWGANFLVPTAFADPLEAAALIWDLVKKRQEQGKRSVLSKWEQGLTVKGIPHQPTIPVVEERSSCRLPHRLCQRPVLHHYAGDS